jgi:site-specific recombinase XerD
MFQDRLHGEYLSWYLISPHKDRIDLVGETLLSQNYRFAVVQNHLLEWLRLSKYLYDHNISLPLTILSPKIQDYLKVRFPKGSKSRLRGIRASIRIFLEANEYGEFSRRIKIRKSPSSILYQQWIVPYINYLRLYRKLAESTLRCRRTFLDKFYNFLEKSGVHRADDLSHQIISDSFTGLGGWGHAMRIGYVSALRGFLKWGYSESLFPKDLSGAVITVRSYRDSKIPDVLSEQEVEQILSSVDRSTLLGKRNYAILLLAARYGLRPCDIRNLCFENIQFRQGIISLTQSKTANPLLLPLTEDVSDAIIEYLKVRPDASTRKIFIRHLAPYEPFSENNNLSDVMHWALIQAGISDRKGLRGLYLFRHSLATRLLKEDNPVSSIADILGHSDLSSTFIYTKVDMEGLRTVSMSIREVLS